MALVSMMRFVLRGRRLVHFFFSSFPILLPASVATKQLGGTEREEQKRKLKSTKRMTGVDEDFLGCLQIANVGWSAATAAGTGIFDDDGFGGG